MDVLDRLEEDHRIDRLVEVLDEPTPEAQVRAPVAGAGVLVSLGIRVDADHLGGPPRQQVRAVALAAGEVGDPQARAALGDPLVDGDVPAVPVVLLRDIGQRALARQLERRHPLGLVLLQIDPIGFAHSRGS